MNERIKNHIEGVFSQAPNTRRALELKDELTANLNDKYNDLIEKGNDEETAFKAAVAGIGDTDELIRGLRGTDFLDPVQFQMQRQKSALLISVAVAIYILSFIFPIMFDWIGGFGETLGIVLMFVCWAVATMLIVYNGLSKLKYVKVEDTLVEDFKEFRSVKVKNDAVRKSINSLVWMLAVMIFLGIGMFTGVWNPTWLVFVLAPVVTHIINLVSIYRGE